MDRRKAGRMTATGAMPPTGYSLLHGPAWLRPDERQRLAAWFRSTFGAAEGNGTHQFHVDE